MREEGDTHTRPDRGSYAPARPWVVAFGLIALLQVLTLLAMPIVYDTMHLRDTLFLLDEAWRITLGLLPGVDFGSFYPGMAARFVAWAFALVGPSVRALDVAPLLQLAAILPLAISVLYRRCGPFSFMAVVALITTVLLTRAPLEEYVSLTKLVSAHSFSYNRIGLASCIVILLLVLLPARPGHLSEGLAGLAGGIAMALALMSKWSFLIVLPAAVLALALQRRPAALAGLLAGTLLFWMSVDPLGRQFFGSAAYMQAAAAAEDGFGGLSGVLFKAQRMVLSHLWILLALAFSLVVALRSHWAGGRWVWLISVALMIVAIGGNLVVMGPFGLVGHQILPAAAALSIVCLERTARGPDQRQSGMQQILASLLLLVFLLPHLANALLVTAAGYKNRGAVLLSEGQMAGYLHRHAAGLPTGDRTAILERAAAMIADQGRVTRNTEYPAFVDGVLVLSSLGDLTDMGIVSEGNFSFEFALGFRPVVDYPLWPRVSSPEILATEEIPEKADIVMILRDGPGPLGNLLLERIGENFRVCRETEIWMVFARDSVIQGKCCECWP